MPTLWSFLEHLVPKAKQKFLCFVIAMIMKMQCKQLCQVQKAVSMMLYGNGVHKQVLFIFDNFYFVMTSSLCYGRSIGACSLS